MKYAVFEQKTIFKKDGELTFFTKRNNIKINIELAETNAKGLMFRKDLPDDAGMFFEFDSDQILSFWMKNTYIPLDIIYVNSKYQIVDIREAKPMNIKSIISKKPAKYVVEVNAGFCDVNNIKEGDFIDYDLELIRELFDSNPYNIEGPFEIEKRLHFDKVYEYRFKTDKNFYYVVRLSFKERTLNIGFFVSGRGCHDDIGNFEMNRIFPTLKIILDKHQEEFDKIQINSDPKRIRIYKELFIRMGYKVINENDKNITAYVI